MVGSKSIYSITKLAWRAERTGKFGVGRGRKRVGSDGKEKPMNAQTTGHAEKYGAVIGSAAACLLIFGALVATDSAIGSASDSASALPTLSLTASPHN
jgi:hypothetical protein